MVKDKSMKIAIKELKRQLKKGSVGCEGYEIMRHIRDGHISSVFFAEKNYEDYVLKVISPFSFNWMYYLFFQEEHGYFDDNAVNAAFWRRKFANRLTKCFDSDIDILDATQQSSKYRGFYAPFIKNQGAKTSEEKSYVLEKMTNLSHFFKDIGMPSWSFNPDYPFYKTRSANNCRLNGKKIIIIDYESAVLTPNRQGLLDLDPIDFETVGKHIQDNKKSLLDCLGDEEFKIMNESFEKCRHYTQLWHSGEKRTIQKIISTKELEKTVQGLINEGVFSAEEVKSLNSNEMTNYILNHLGVHLAIGFTIGLFTGPIPVGLFPRGAWTIGNRIYQEIKGNKEKARVHSIGVLAWSSFPIPILNYFGYLLPLKRVNNTAALVYGEHMIRVMKGKSLDEYLSKKSMFTRMLVEKAIIPENKRDFYRKKKNE